MYTNDSIGVRAVVHMFIHCVTNQESHKYRELKLDPIESGSGLEEEEQKDEDHFYNSEIEANYNMKTYVKHGTSIFWWREI